MNIKINKEEADYIFSLNNKQYIFGSKLYGTSNDDSDTDILVIYESFHKESDVFYPNYHQFQYDDLENNKQYVFTSKEMFYKNLLSGDSTINSDIVLFNDNFIDIKDKLNICRTYKVIKAYIGFANRDIKNINKGKNKHFHIERSLYSAEKLLNNELPNIDDFKNFNLYYNELKDKESNLRLLANELFDKNILTMFPKIPLIKSDNPLENKLIESNNIREFKY